MVSIVAFAGSTRRESLNRQLLGFAVDEIQAVGGEVRLLDLADYPMPIYNADLQAEWGIPRATHTFVDALREATALLIATPEYNGGYPPVLKNALDWATRVDRRIFMMHFVGLMSASPGSRGGVRGLAQLDQLFRNMRTPVFEPGFSLGSFHDRVDGDRIVDVDTAESLRAWSKEFVREAEAWATRPREEHS